MSDQAAQLAQVRRHWEHIGTDPDISHEMYHDDAVLEFPQSGERFEGVANFKEWRSQYPAEVQYRIRRMTAREDLVVVECAVSYNGSPWQFGVQLLEFRGEKPFSDVIIHATLMDDKGDRMSKSKGTGVDPLSLGRI